MRQINLIWRGPDRVWDFRAACPVTCRSKCWRGGRPVLGYQDANAFGSQHFVALQAAGMRSGHCGAVNRPGPRDCSGYWMTGSVAGLV
jgi:hypothetical protein